MTHITLAIAMAEPDEDRLFGPTYIARQIMLAKHAEEALQNKTEQTLVRMPVKRAERHGAALKRGTRVIVDVGKIDPAEWLLIGRETMSSVGTVKACRYGMIEIQWGCTRWWVDSQFVEVIE